MQLYLSSSAAFSSVDEKVPSIKCKQKIDFVFNFHLTNILNFNGIIRVQKNLIFDPFSENNICSEVFFAYIFCALSYSFIQLELISLSQHIFISLKFNMLQIVEMKTPRFRHCAFAVDGFIFVCGGIDRDRYANFLSSVEQFIANDARGWIKLPKKMKQKRFSFNSNFLLII